MFVGRVACSIYLMKLCSQHNIMNKLCNEKKKGGFFEKMFKNDLAQCFSAKNIKLPSVFDIV